MRTPYGAWRATYTQGRWVVLSGPTSMVVMGPARPGASTSAVSRLINEVWDELLTSSSITQISANLTRFGLDEMPDLGVLFWDEGQLHCLVRGQVRVLDAQTGAVLASGAGARTWYEANLSTKRVYLPLDDVADAEALRLPLVVGAAQVSTVYLDAEADLAAQQEAGDAAGAAPGQATGAPFVVHEPEPDEPPVEFLAEPEPESDVWRYDEPEADLEPSSEDEQPDELPALTPAAGRVGVEPTQLLGERPPYAQGQEPGEQSGPTGLADQGFGLGATGTTGPWGAGGFAAALASAGQVVTPPTVTPQDAAESMDRALQDASEALDFLRPRAADRRDRALPEVGDAFGPVLPEAADGPVPPEADGPAAPEVDEPDSLLPESDVPRVLAVLCPSGHPNAPGAARCRVCDRNIEAQIPRKMRRPVLAVVTTPAGDRLPLRGPIVVGRAPSDIGNDPEVELLRVPSPHHDISRSHVRIAGRDWQIEVTDLHSTNGTVVTRPSGERIRLEPGEHIELGIGASIDLGDGQVLQLLAP